MCGCDSIREGSGGVSYSYAILGVLCPSCEAMDAEYEYKAWWDSLSPGEQVRERWLNAVAHVKWRGRNMHRQNNAGFPPF